MRALYEHDDYLVDIYLKPTTDDARSHYNIPVLAITAHESRGRVDNVIPLPDILDGAHLMAIGGILLADEPDDDPAQMRVMLGLPPGHPAVAPTRRHALAVGARWYGGYLKGTDEESRWSQSCDWIIHPDGVICEWGIARYARTPAQVGADVYGCDDNTPDDARAAIIAAGWPLAYATQAEQDAALNAALDRAEAECRRQKEARSGGQRTDDTPLATDMPVITPADLRADVGGKPRVACRVYTPGYASSDDLSGIILEDYLRKAADVKVHYAAPAISTGYVGTMAGPIEELCYTARGQRWYAYLITSDGGDTWCQEWWVSYTRYDAHTAADIIEACRTALRQPAN